MSRSGPTLPEETRAKNGWVRRNLRLRKEVSAALDKFRGKRSLNVALAELLGIKLEEKR